MTRRLDDDPLLQSCLRDLRFDQQLEDSRGEWLWRMIRAVDAADRFRVPILHALYDLSDERSAHQLCELARHYAEAGDETFRMRLYEIVEQKSVADRLWLGEEEIVRLDGEAGFLFAARVRGKQLASREWEWDEGSLVDDAVGRFGEERVNDLLENTGDGALGIFREGWRRQKEAMAGRKQQTPHRDRMRALNVVEILVAAESNEARFGFFFFRGWGMYADAADLEIVLQHLRAARDPTVIANLLGVFSNRAAPRFDARLIELCQHKDTEVRRRAFIALENIEHPLVREFALAELENGVRDGSVAGLFIRNYQPGDEPRILESIESPADDCERHGLLMDVVKLLEANLDADCSQLGVIAYASTPCENCRFRAVRLLLNHRVAPEWLIDEGRYDSGEDCRELVAKAERSTVAG